MSYSIPRIETFDIVGGYDHSGSVATTDIKHRLDLLVAVPAFEQDTFGRTVTPREETAAIEAAQREAATRVLGEQVLQEALSPPKPRYGRG